MLRITASAIPGCNVPNRDERQLEDGLLRTAPGFRAAFDQVRAGGCTGLDGAEAFDSQGLPDLIATALDEIRVSGNMALNMYHRPTHYACWTNRTHGAVARTALCRPRLGSCDWTGAMNFTVSRAGTVLTGRKLPQNGGKAMIGVFVLV